MHAVFRTYQKQQVVRYFLRFVFLTLLLYSLAHRGHGKCYNIFAHQHMTIYSTSNYSSNKTTYTHNIATSKYIYIQLSDHYGHWHMCRLRNHKIMWRSVCKQHEIKYSVCLFFDQNELLINVSTSNK